jgi:outer membrane protein insertion porin family
MSLFARSVLLVAVCLGSASHQTGAQQREPERFTVVPREQSLQPMPLDQPVPVQFNGARAYTPDQLREPLVEQLRDIRSDGLTKPRADDTAYYLSVFYRKQGYSAAEVNWEIRGSLLVLNIREGPRTYLRRVTFLGNRWMAEATLYQYMIGATEERLLREPQQFPFVEGDIRTGADRIRGLYEQEGYADAVVDEPAITYTRDRSAADVTIRIREGPRYGFGTVDFIGETLFPRAELIGGLGTPLNEPYTTQRVNSMQRNLEFFFKSRGYFVADAIATVDESRARPTRRNPDGTGYDRLVPVRIEVKPGGMYRFDGVTVTGTDQLRPSFLPQRFRSLTGDVYDPVRLDEKQRELLRTGLFQSFRINSVAQPDNTVRLDITVEEAKPKEFSASLGFSTYEGLVTGARIANRNLYGTGRSIALEVEHSLRTIGAELLYLDPWLFETENSLRARLYLQTREEEGYTKQEAGFRFDLTRQVTKNIELGTYLQFENVEITETVIDPIYLGLTAYQIATLGFSQKYDFRDNPLNPSRGWIVNTTLDADVIAGELAFGRATARFSYYWPIGEKMLLAAGLRGGLVYPLTSVPIDERYFVGGGTTVRSFRERQLGPKDPQGYPIGGEAFTVFNLELDFPIRDALRGAVFFDAGNLIAEFENAGVEDMRYAVGVGLRYNLPIGPIRLDVGINPTPRNSEDWGAVHFSFGFAF